MTRTKASSRSRSKSDRFNLWQSSVLIRWPVSREMRRIEQEDFKGIRSNRVFYVSILSKPHTSVTSLKPITAL